MELVPSGGGWVGTFGAMASLCEVHVAGAGRDEAREVARSVAAEAWRIEEKYSRYVERNIVARINSAEGREVTVDEETSRLLSYAETLHRLSDGRFDVTSGVLRRVWRFDGGDRIPSRRAVRDALALVGWHRVRWAPPVITMAPGMEIDFGGIGKEYAVDRCGAIAKALWPHCLVNFGGDLLAVAPQAGGAPWRVGIERVDAAGAADRGIELAWGGLATSGDSRRYVLHEGKRYGHVLDARTGWPVPGAPRSVTVAAPSCTQAGMLATLALLCGAGAEAFLEEQGAAYWCRR